MLTTALQLLLIAGGMQPLKRLIPVERQSDRCLIKVDHNYTLRTLDHAARPTPVHRRTRAPKGVSDC